MSSVRGPNNRGQPPSPSWGTYETRRQGGGAPSSGRKPYYGAGGPCENPNRNAGQGRDRLSLSGSGQSRRKDDVWAEYNRVHGSSHPQNAGTSMCRKKNVRQVHGRESHSQSSRQSRNRVYGDGGIDPYQANGSFHWNGENNCSVSRNVNGSARGRSPPLGQFLDRNNHQSHQSPHRLPSFNKVQLHVLFTHQKTKKKKLWIDGRLVLSGTHGALYEACPNPGSSGGAIDALEVKRPEAAALAEGCYGHDYLESEKFLIQVEGPWIDSGDGGGDALWNMQLKSNAPGRREVARNQSKGMQRLMASKFRAPAKVLPLPPEERRRRAWEESKMNKRRRPLQPGELECRYYGDDGNGGYGDGGHGDGGGRCSSDWNNLNDEAYHAHRGQNTGDPTFGSQNPYHSADGSRFSDRNEQQDSRRLNTEHWHNGYNTNDLNDRGGYGHRGRKPEFRANDHDHTGMYDEEEDSANEHDALGGDTYAADPVGRQFREQGEALPQPPGLFGDNNQSNSCEVSTLNQNQPRKEKNSFDESETHRGGHSFSQGHRNDQHANDELLALFGAAPASSLPAGENSDVESSSQTESAKGDSLINQRQGNTSNELNQKGIVDGRAYGNNSQEGEGTFLAGILEAEEKVNSTNITLSTSLDGGWEEDNEDFGASDGNGNDDDGIDHQHSEDFTPDCGDSKVLDEEKIDPQDAEAAQEAAATGGSTNNDKFTGFSLPSADESSSSEEEGSLTPADT